MSDKIPAPIEKQKPIRFKASLLIFLRLSRPQLHTRRSQGDSLKSSASCVLSCLNRLPCKIKFPCFQTLHFAARINQGPERIRLWFRRSSSVRPRLLITRSPCSGLMDCLRHFFWRCCAAHSPSAVQLDSRLCSNHPRKKPVLCGLPNIGASVPYQKGLPLPTKKSRRCSFRGMMNRMSRAPRRPAFKPKVMPLAHRSKLWRPPPIRNGD